MSPEINAEEHLVEHYATLGCLKSDFRNLNLFHLVAAVVTGKNVIDIGCGAAFLANILKERGKHVVGIEPSGGMRALAAEINPGVAIIPGMAEDVDALVREPVDAVLMIDVLEHIEKDVEQIKKVLAVLKKGGEFVFVVPAHSFLFGKRDEQMGHYRRYSKKRLTELLESNGFRIKFLRHWNALGFLPYLISEKVLRKPLNSKLRQIAKHGVLSALMQKGLNFWFSRIENNFDFGFGLSIIGVARKES